MKGKMKKGEKEALGTNDGKRQKGDPSKFAKHP